MKQGYGLEGPSRISPPKHHRQRYRAGFPGGKLLPGARSGKPTISSGGCRRNKGAEGLRATSFRKVEPWALSCFYHPFIILGSIGRRGGGRGMMSRRATVISGPDGSWATFLVEVHAGGGGWSGVAVAGRAAVEVRRIRRRQRGRRWSQRQLG